jgi:hypothetical protein
MKTKLTSTKKLAISPKVSKLMGVIFLPEDFDYKIDLKKVLNKRYQKR